MSEYEITIYPGTTLDNGLFYRLTEITQWSDSTEKAKLVKQNFVYFTESAYKTYFSLKKEEKDLLCEILIRQPKNKRISAITKTIGIY